LYDPVAGAFVELGPLLRKRDGGCALTLLKDGRVLISGGRNDAELSDPATRRFSPGSTMNNFHPGANPLLLMDGAVLLRAMISMDAATRRRRLKFIIRRPVDGAAGRPSNARDAARSIWTLSY
jgi:hypothetical protein